MMKEIKEKDARILLMEMNAMRTLTEMQQQLEMKQDKIRIEEKQ